MDMRETSFLVLRRPTIMPCMTTTAAPGRPRRVWRMARIAAESRDSFPPHPTWTPSTTCAFRRIVELGSLAKAAEVLDMSSAGLSKQLRALESHLGAVLIQRTTRKMSLTDTGTAYYAECCRLLDELDALENPCASSPSASRAGCA